MRLWDSAWKALKLVGAARELAIDTRRFHWEVAPGSTFFLQAETADISLRTHQLAEVRATIELQAGFGWQLLTEQDEAGVYIIARRKPLLGSIGRCRFDITIPQDAHISFKLEQCQVCFVDLNTALDLPPLASEL